MKMLHLALIINMLTIMHCQRNCLHNGCEMSGGLKMADINSTIEKTLGDRNFKDNVLSTLSWNIEQPITSFSRQNMADICHVINKVAPMFAGLQSTSEEQRRNLKVCLHQHSIIGEDSDNNLQNVILFKHSRRILIKDHGSFKASNYDVALKQSSTCTWARVQFAHRVRGFPMLRFSGADQPKENDVEKLFGILSLLLPQNRRRSRRDVKSPYRWSTFYVAVMKIHNDDDEGMLREEFRSLLSNLRNKVMKRRRFPLILLVDLGKEDNSLAYQLINEQFYWIKNTMAHSILTFPAMTKTNKEDRSSETMSDYVMKNRFHGLVSAVLTDDVIKGISNTRPVFAAMMRYRENNST
eukprot:TCONS_00073796-protein